MFSEVGTYKAVGLFSTTHIISIFVCFVFIALAVVLTRKISKELYFKLLKIFAVVITVLEIFKIFLSWHEKNFQLNAWLPLFFCSLFIYALWLACCKKQILRDLGLSYIACASIVAGVVFIIFPTTSFTWYPIFHFKCLYSMLYHSLMVYSGVMLYVTKSFVLDIKAVLKYCIFTLSFMIFALIININFGSNLMFISNPGVVPLPFLHTIYNFSPLLYTIVMLFAHIVLMGFGVYGIARCVAYFKNKHNKVENINLEETEHKIS